MGDDYKNELQAESDKKDKSFYKLDTSSNTITLNDDKFLTDEKFDEISESVDNLIGTFAC